jgi:hypothetical protein
MKIESCIHRTLENRAFCIFTTFLLFKLLNQEFGGKKITKAHLHKLRADKFEKRAFSTVRKKVKAIPLLALTGPEGFRRLRLPDFNP